MSQLRAEMKLNDTQMKATGTSVEGLQKKHDLLESQLKASQDKTEALNQKVQKAIQYFGEDSMEVAKLKTQLTNAQTAEENLKQAVEKCADEIKAQERASEQAESATSQLTERIQAQRKEVDRLKDKYVEACLKYGATSDEAEYLGQEIEILSRDLQINEEQMKETKKAADELDRSMRKLDDGAEKAEGGFTIFKGVVADLASKAIQHAIGKVSEFVGWLKGLPETTREIRQDMATLDTSFENTGFSTEVATKTWKDLYAVFGEDDRAVEASNLIAKMCKDQEDLNNWVTITTGIWGSYQDSLPVEGLAEASMETAKTGQVTGVLADALNWSSEAASMFADYMSEDVVTAEDAFNVALCKCTTEQERQTLITDTLTALYGDAADKYRDTASAQMEAKEATADQIIAENDLADALEPVTTKFTELKTSLVEDLQPAIEAISGAMLDALEWMEDHPVAMKVIVAVIGTLAAAFSGLAIALGVYTAAQWLANAAFAPMILPIIGIVAAIAAVVAIIVLCVEYWDIIVLTVQNAIAKVKEVLGAIGEWINTNVIQPVVVFFQGVWNDIKDIWDKIKNTIQVKSQNIKERVTTTFENIKKAITSPIEKAKEKIKESVDKIKGFFADLKLKLPDIKVPTFKITGKFSFDPPSVPKLSIKWNKLGAIFTRPTIFDTPLGWQGVGEAGPEAVLPIDRLESYIENAIERTQQVVNFERLADSIENLASRAIELKINDRTIAETTASANDNVNGLRNTFRSRGLILD